MCLELSYGQKITFGGASLGLIDAGADIHAMTADRRAPLHLAAAGDHHCCLELLLELRAVRGESASASAAPGAPSVAAALRLAAAAGAARCVSTLCAAGECTIGPLIWV